MAGVVEPLLNVKCTWLEELNGFTNSLHFYPEMVTIHSIFRSLEMVMRDALLTLSINGLGLVYQVPTPMLIIIIL